MSDRIEKVITLRCLPERAFELFTEEAGAWWPADRRHTKDPTSDIVMQESGRFFERAHDGREVELGVVRVFTPHEYLLLDWFPGTGADLPTHVEVRFEPVGDGTRVTVVHGPGPASRDAYAQKAQAYERSWTAVLEALALAALTDRNESVTTRE